MSRVTKRRAGSALLLVIVVAALALVASGCSAKAATIGSTTTASSSTSTTASHRRQPPPPWQPAPIPAGYGGRKDGRGVCGGAARSPEGRGANPIDLAALQALAVAQYNSGNYERRRPPTEDAPDKDDPMTRTTTPTCSATRQEPPRQTPNMRRPSRPIRLSTVAYVESWSVMYNDRRRTSRSQQGPRSRYRRHDRG